MKKKYSDLNYLIRIVWSIAVIFVFCSSLQTVKAQNILDSSQYLFFKPGDNTRVGIEVEFKGLSVDKSAEVVAQTLGGKIERRTVKDYILQRMKPGGIRVWKEVERTDTYVAGTKIGDVLLKIDTNELADGAIDESQAVVELVTKPINEEQTQQLQKSITALKNAGAKGTDPHTAVSTQVNVELAHGNRAEAKVEDMLNIVRNYYKPEHYKQISEAMQIPANRQPYVEGYSPGYMKKLMDPTYKPTWRQAYDDFMYRQSLEVLGVKDAWTMPIETAKARLLAMPDPMVPKVIKLNGVRLSSMFMWMFPDDPLSKVIENSKWAFPRPLIEFRDWNNTFDVVGPTRQALGLKRASAAVGSFDHDTLVADKLHVTPQVVAEQREKLDTMSHFDRKHTLQRTAEVAQLRSEDEALERFKRLNSGPPARMGEVLPESTYVQVKARKLKDPKLLYVNREMMLKKYGINIPPEGPTEAQKKAILDAVGWRIPAEFDPPGMYGPEERVLYSTRYGGDGLNGNFGSGRGAEAGEWEGKGFGQTPHVSPAATDYYKKGGGPAYIVEGVREGIVSGAAQDLPHGGNNLLFLVDTGDGTRSLIVRESDIRLGHMTPRFHHAGDENPANRALHDGEMKRVYDLIKEQKVMDAIPIPRSADLLSPREQYIQGAQRLAYMYGEEAAGAYANGFIHGTTSASNQLINGGITDFGSTSYHPNHAPLQMLEDSAPAGRLEAEEVVMNIAPEGLNDLAPHGDIPLPTREQVQDIARKGYQSKLREEFLKMSGLPEKMAVQFKDTAEGRRLADTLIKIAEDAAGKMNIKYHTPTQMTRYNIRPLIMDLANISGGSQANLEAVLAKHMAGHGGPLSEPNYWKQVAREYREVMDLAAAKAAKDGIKKSAFFRLVKENSRYARERWQLNHFALEKLSNEALERYHQTGDPNVVQRIMDQEIAKNRLNHSGFKPYESVIGYKNEGGMDIYRVFDAAQNKEVLVVRSPIAAGGSVNVGSNHLNLKKALATRTQVKVNDKALPSTTAVANQAVEYRVDLPKDMNGDFGVSLFADKSKGLGRSRGCNMKGVLESLMH